MLHHRCMAAIVDKPQSGIRNQSIEFVRHQRRCNSIIQTPYQKRGHLYIRNFVSEVAPLSGLGNRNNPQTLRNAVCNVKYFVYEFFGSHFRIVKSIRYPFPDVLVISAFWLRTPHRILKKARATGEDQTCYTGFVIQGVQ